MRIHAFPVKNISKWMDMVGHMNSEIYDTNWFLVNEDKSILLFLPLHVIELRF